MDRRLLSRFAWLSILAAVVTICLKSAAYLLTGSVGLLSDAVESLVNLAASLFALMALSIAWRPPDEEHEHGHDKVEYFSSGLEGALILVAAVSIAVTALQRLVHPEPIERVGLGVAATLLASLINLAVARLLLRVGNAYRSIVLEADANHLMADVWTSAAVVVGIVVVSITGWLWLDPVIALAVAVNILRAGAELVRRSVLGLLDTALPSGERNAVQAVLERYEEQGIQSHALRTRQSGSRRFVSVHVLVPGVWSVQRGHDLVEAIERDISDAVPGSTVLTHLEPLDDPVSWQDTALSRTEGADANAQPGPDRTD